MNTQYNKSSFQNTPFVTYGIIAITVIMYLLMTFNGGSEDLFVLVRYGAKFNPAIIIFNEWWRLITPIFLHVGFAHILFNLVIVYFLGGQLEMLFGHGKYFTLYMLSGIMGNIFSFAFNESVSAGASTAIFGLFISIITLNKIYPNTVQLGAMARRYGVLIAINIIFGIMSTGVDNMGHIGGVVGGYLITHVLVSNPRNDHKKADQLRYLLFYIGIALILIFWGYNEIMYLGF